MDLLEPRDRDERDRLLSRPCGGLVVGGSGGEVVLLGAYEDLQLGAEEVELLLQRGLRGTEVSVGLSPRGCLLGEVLHQLLLDGCLQLLAVGRESELLLVLLDLREAVHGGGGGRSHERLLFSTRSVSAFCMTSCAEPCLPRTPNVLGRGVGTGKMLVAGRLDFVIPAQRFERVDVAVQRLDLGLQRLDGCERLGHDDFI